MERKKDILRTTQTTDIVQEEQFDPDQIPLQQAIDHRLEDHQLSSREALSQAGISLLDAQFQRDLEDQLDTIREFHRRFQFSSISIWPTFKIDASIGNLKMDLVELPDPENLFFLLVRMDNRIVGYRRFRFVHGNKVLYAKGSIGVGLKGKGLAVPIELAFMKFLQLRANELKTKIIWEVENLNLPRVQELRIKYEKQETIAEELHEAEKEQERWQAMYGEGGKLGIKSIDKNYGKKEFIPEKLDIVGDSHFPPLDKVAEIRLQRLTQMPENLATSLAIEVKWIQSKVHRKRRVLRRLEKDLK